MEHVAPAEIPEGCLSDDDSWDHFDALQPEALYPRVLSRGRWPLMHGMAEVAAFGA